jgi:hypothetical protein
MITSINIAKAIHSLRDNPEFVVFGDKIEWHSPDITQPTDEEIQAEIIRLQAEFDSQQYARDRASAYPSLTDQADMAYWDRQDGTTTLDDAIAAVKAEFPKP